MFRTDNIIHARVRELNVMTSEMKENSKRLHECSWSSPLQPPLVHPLLGQASPLQRGRMIWRAGSTGPACDPLPQPQQRLHLVHDIWVIRGSILSLGRFVAFRGVSLKMLVLAVLVAGRGFSIPIYLSKDTFHTCHGHGHGHGVFILATSPVRSSPSKGQLITCGAPEAEVGKNCCTTWSTDDSPAMVAPRLRKINPNA